MKSQIKSGIINQLIMGLLAPNMYETFIIQGVPWQRASGIGLLQACFRTSEVPKGVIVTHIMGANYI